MKRKIIIGVFALAAVLAPAGSAVYASNQTQLEQVITSGSLTTDVVDGSGNSVAAPSVDLNSVSASASPQTTSSTYGTASERIQVNNPGSANNGWSLTVAATDGPTALWNSGANTFDFNDPAGGGETNGQLTLDPSVATINVTAPSTTTGITLGTSAAFNQGTVDTITLATAGASSQDVWQGYLTGVGVSQKIPGGQAPGTYHINLTQTVTAL